MYSGQSLLQAEALSLWRWLGTAGFQTQLGLKGISSQGCGQDSLSEP